ncbi:MAG: aspartate aminotransferase family protein [Labilithrix sp.]|nr:aspartate aminotransferase family protein [Labilithrix sp.]
MRGLSHPAAQKYAAHVNPTLVNVLGAFGYGRVWARAKGTSLWDTDGNEYLDFLAASGAANLGHNPPKLLERLRDGLDDDPPNLGQAGVSAPAADLAAALAKLAAPLTRVLLGATAGEAIDSALKIARAATRRKPLVHCRGGFHGSGIGGLSISGHGRLRDPFEPLVGQCYEIPFDDLAALAKALDEKKPAAFVVEPIQVEAGVVVPRGDYLRQAHAMCKKAGTLLVLDEVQTGLGRTGKMFAYDHDGFVPDVLVLGEALGGGIVPMSATLTTEEVHDRAYGRMDRFDLQGATYGNALGCRIALATLETLETDGLAEAARERGELLLERLRDELGDHPFVKAVRGRGLLVGIELGPTRASGLLGRLLPSLVEGLSRRIFGQWLAVRLLERGIVCQPASQQWNVLKLAPPLTVTAKEIDRVVDAIADVLAQNRDLKVLLADAGQRFGAQLIASWSA